jgi:hypothetical protein
LHVINFHVKVPNILIYQFGWGLFFKGQYTHAMHMVGFANSQLENHLIYHLGRLFRGFCYGFCGFFWAYWPKVCPFMNQPSWDFYGSYNKMETKITICL